MTGALDLRGKTTLRQLVRLMYHADGVVCPVTFLMHLAAAVPTKDPHRLRPCVVVAGGREPPHWEAYPGHQFVHTVGMLPCCRTGGCWRARTKPLRDNSHFNRPEHLCVDVVGNLPRCMDLIQASDVIRRIEMYLDGKKRFDLLFEKGRRPEVRGGPSGAGDERANVSGELTLPLPATEAARDKTRLGDENDLILAYYVTDQTAKPSPGYFCLGYNCWTFASDMMSQARGIAKPRPKPVVPCYSTSSSPHAHSSQNAPPAKLTQ